MSGNGMKFHPLSNDQPFTSPRPKGWGQEPGNMKVGNDMPPFLPQNTTTRNILIALTIAVIVAVIIGIIALVRVIKLDDHGCCNGETTIRTNARNGKGKPGDDDNGGELVLVTPEVLTFNLSRIVFPDEGFMKMFEGIDGAECFPLAAFGVEKACRQIDGFTDPHGSIDTIIWKADSNNGIQIPAHRHPCSDETWYLINGSCTFWKGVEGNAVNDWLGLPWGQENTIQGPATMYMARGVWFSWSCTPNTWVWSSFTPGRIAGLFPLVAIDIFGPNNTLPQTKTVIRAVAGNWCTEFREAALEAFNLPE